MVLVPFFTYAAEIVAEDMANVDACVLRINSKFERPVQCSGTKLDTQPEKVVGSLKRDKLQRLSMTRNCQMSEQIRMIGFNQTGEGRFEPGHHINHAACISKGYVCKVPEKDSNVSSYVKNKVFSPSDEIVVDCAIYKGHSGGPCFNQDGRVVGIVSRVDPLDP